MNKIAFYNYKKQNIEIVQGVCTHSFPAHIHRNLCIGMITDGFAVFSINGDEKMLTTGDCYIIPPYAPHSLSSVNDKEFRYTVCCFKDTDVRLNTDSIVRSAIDYIENSKKDFNLDSLSKVVHISKYHLARKFKEQVGITPYQFCINSRISKIRHHLQTQSSLSDLTYDLGFTDQSHLCNTFKKHMGITPLQYSASYYRC